MTSRCSERKKERAVSNDSFKNDQPFLVITKESICKVSQLTGERWSYGISTQLGCREDIYGTSKPNSEFIYNWKAMVISQRVVMSGMVTWESKESPKIPRTTKMFYA